MRATLHHGASNTYYGQWNARILRQHRQIDRSIAHNELGASPKFAAVEGCGRVLPGNRGSARGKFTPARKRNFGRAKPQNSEQLSVELKIIRL
ncbi:MAG: hypothetical protein J0J01_03550 [Reyranella sp.]|uniref:hypothetical protein n=1 Tax=Reyranella sp. TaxID=1929291 RepID=UPI001AC76D70|nr:hypothetical protein [Reyranella sp.]MBN9085963.1 hypothetical protein [Reyranella sp.]